MNDPNNQSFSSLLRAYRITAGFSQNKLARRVYVNPAHVNHIEKRGKLPSRQLALSLAEVLRLNPLQTDHFLWTAGHAPIIDWQTRALEAEHRLNEIKEILCRENTSLTSDLTRTLT